MNEVQVKKAELIIVLKKNKKTHREEFLKAIEGYRKEAINQLSQSISDAKNGKKINLHFQLTQPIDQTKDYDRVIGMLEMSIDEELMLSEGEYRQYVMDDWVWKEQFTVTNAFYTKGT